MKKLTLTVFMIILLLPFAYAFSFSDFFSKMSYYVVGGAITSQTNCGTNTACISCVNSKFCKTYEGITYSSPQEWANGLCGLRPQIYWTACSGTCSNGVCSSSGGTPSTGTKCSSVGGICYSSCSDMDLSPINGNCQLDGYSSGYVCCGGTTTESCSATQLKDCACGNYGDKYDRFCTTCVNSKWSTTSNKVPCPSGTTCISNGQCAYIQPPSTKTCSESGGNCGLKLLSGLEDIGRLTCKYPLTCLKLKSICDNNGVCNTGETKENCPNDCKTVITPVGQYEYGCRASDNSIYIIDGSNWRTLGNCPTNTKCDSTNDEYSSTSQTSLSTLQGKFCKATTELECTQKGGHCADSLLGCKADSDEVNIGTVLNHLGCGAYVCCKSTGTTLPSCKATTTPAEITQKLQLTTTDKDKFVDSHKCTQSSDCCDETSGVVCVPNQEANKWGLDWGDWFFNENEGFCFKDLPLCYGCENGVVKTSVAPCEDGYSTTPITKCGENDSVIIEEPKSPSLPYDKWETASAGMRIKTVCSTTDNCAEYKDLYGTGKKYTVSCESTQDMMTRLELDYKEQCKSSWIKKIGNEASILSLAGCAISIGTTIVCATTGIGVPCTIAGAKVSIYICGSALLINAQTLTGCAILSQPDISKGACIAVPKGGTPSDLCYPWVESIGSIFSKDNSCLVGWIATAIGGFLVLLLLMRMMDKK